MPSPLSCLAAADSAEAKAVPQTQSEQGQQPRESVTRDDLPSPLLSSPQQSTLSLLLCREEQERSQTRSLGGNRKSLGCSRCISADGRERLM